MTRKERETLFKLGTDIDFIINKITVNGDDGSAPLIGLQPILEAGHKNDHIQNKRLDELTEITSGLKAKKKLRESFQAYLDSHSFVKFLLTPNKYKVGIGVALLVFLSEVLGLHGLSNIIKDVFKFAGWIK